MHGTSASWIPMVALAPIGLMLATAMASRFRPTALSSLVGWAVWVTVPVAAMLAAAVAVGGALATPALDVRGFGLSLRADALNVVLYAMVSLLGVVLVRFSRTYLEGDPRRPVFLGRLGATLGAVQLLLLAGSLPLFFAAWVVTSLALHGLLVFYPERPRARIAATKKFIVARIGDATLLLAFLLLYRAFGTADLGALLGAATEATPGAGVPGVGLSVHVAAFLLAVAALFKSAQFPTHGWLVEVMETPTPVSALLHAGILNAGPFLVLRFAAVMELAPGAAVLLVAVGGFTAVFASLVLLTQPSVKVALGYSSAAHMGFTLFVAGLGVYAAAVLHLVGHSFYKAHAFLSSGSAVDVARARHVPVPARLRSPLRIAVSFAASLVVYLAVAGVMGVQPSERPELFAVGAVIVLGLAQLLLPVLDSAATRAGAVRTALAAGVIAVAFFGMESAAHRVLEAALPVPSEPHLASLAAAVVVLLAFAGAIVAQMMLPTFESPRTRAAYVHLRNGLYANAAFDRLVGALRRA